MTTINNTANWTVEDLRGMKTLSVNKTGSLKFDHGGMRVWLNGRTKMVTVKLLRRARWVSLFTYKG